MTEDSLSDTKTRVVRPIRYYSYLLYAWEGPGYSYLYLYSVGDLDGDGQLAWKYMYSQRQEGVYQLYYEWPPAGQEDLYGF